MLHESVLTYCQKKGGEVQGNIHLLVGNLKISPDDPLWIIIDTGTKEIYLRAETLVEKIKWSTALQNTQDTCLRNEANLMAMNNMKDQLSGVRPKED